MAGSVVTACKQALVTLLKARAGLAGVQVAFGYPGNDLAERERIFMGSARASQEQAGLKAGRRFRDETATFEVVVQVESVGGTPEDAETRALALGKEVEECVADNKYLSGSIAGLNWAVVSDWRLDALYNERGSLSELVYTITYNARLT